MDGHARRRIEAGQNAQVFCREYPATEPGLVKLVGQLNDAVTGAVVHAQAQVESDNRRADRTAFRRVALRDLRKMVKAIVHYGRAASADHPELGPVFAQLPQADAVLRYEAAAAAVLETARAQLAVLEPYGLHPDFLATAEQGLKTLVAAREAAEQGRLGRIGARAELRRSVMVLTSVMDRLDAQIQHSFGADPERLAAWAAASKVEPRPAAVKPASGGGVTPPTSSPPAGSGDGKVA